MSHSLLHQLARVRAGDVDGGHGAGDVGDLDVHVPDGVPPPEPLEDAVGARGGRRHVELVVGEPCDRAVVHDPAGVAERTP